MAYVRILIPGRYMDLDPVKEGKVIARDYEEGDVNNFPEPYADFLITEKYGELVEESDDSQEEENEDWEPTELLDNDSLIALATAHNATESAIKAINDNGFSVDEVIHEITRTGKDDRLVKLDVIKWLDSLVEEEQDLKE